jgi:hypothetical protein
MAVLDGGAGPTAGIPSAVETARMFGLDDLVALFEDRAALTDEEIGSVRGDEGAPGGGPADTAHRG